MSLLKVFEEFFGGTLGDWYIYPINLKLKTDSKPFNFKYYPVPIINKETYLKELKRLAEIEALTPVQHSRYCTPIFIIPKKEEIVRFIKYYPGLNQ